MLCGGAAAIVGMRHLRIPDGFCGEAWQTADAYRKKMRAVDRRQRILQGVCQMKNQKYRVNIGFKGKRYYLGTYENYSDAVQARLDAENLIHTGFINTYRAWEKKAKEDPEWAEKNPLVFNVKKENGCLKISE